MKETVWTVQEALNWTETYLESKGDEHPRRSAQYLLSNATGLSRIEVYAYFDRPLSDDERTVLRESLKARAEGAPLQYACKEATFRHLDLFVSPAVLIPRPETEMLVELVLERLPESTEKDDEFLMCDIGTGSGCIALSCAFERSDTRVFASDISSEALLVAKKNAETYSLLNRVSFFQGSLAQPLFDYCDQEHICHIDALVSNLPYIPTSGMETLPGEVKNFEPHLALHGGEDGLELFVKLIDEVEAFLKTGTITVMALELDERNVEKAAELLKQKNLFDTVEVMNDLATRPRFLLAK